MDEARRVDAALGLGYPREMSQLWSALFTQSFGTGPLITWIHGLGESSLCFAEIARHRRLSGFRHQLVDLPGYGRSPWPAAPYSLEQAAQELTAWLASAGEPSVLIGHSMGGVLGQLVAERTSLTALINVDGNLSSGDCTFSSRAAALSMDDFVRHGFDALRDWVYRGGVDKLPLRGYYASMRLADPRVFHRHSQDLLAYAQPADFAARAAALSIPALYLAGVPDGACAQSRQLLDDAGARWRGLSPAGHWPFLDVPDAFAAAVAEFLAPIAAAEVAPVLAR